MRIVRWSEVSVDICSFYREMSDRIFSRNNPLIHFLSFTVADWIGWKLENHPSVRTQGQHSFDSFIRDSFYISSFRKIDTYTKSRKTFRLKRVINRPPGGSNESHVKAIESYANAHTILRPTRVEISGRELAAIARKRKEKERRWTLVMSDTCVCRVDERERRGRAERGWVSKRYKRSTKRVSIKL